MQLPNKTFTTARPAPLQGTVSLGDTLSAVTEDVFATNPATAVGDFIDIAGKRGAKRTSDSLGRGGARAEVVEPETIPIEEQTRRLKELGLDGQIEPYEGETEEGLSQRIKWRQDELKRQSVLMASDRGIGTTLASFATGLGVSLLDPLNVASGFVPVVGGARYAKMLKDASGPLARAGVRARIGALEGAVGAALVEPLVLAGADLRAADYDLYDSLANIVFGTALGGGLHAAGGAIIDSVSFRELDAIPARSRRDALAAGVAAVAEGRKPIVTEGVVKASAESPDIQARGEASTETLGVKDTLGDSENLGVAKINPERGAAGVPEDIDAPNAFKRELGLPTDEGSIGRVFGDAVGGKSVSRPPKNAGLVASAETRFGEFEVWENRKGSTAWLIEKSGGSMRDIHRTASREKAKQWREAVQRAKDEPEIAERISRESARTDETQGRPAQPSESLTDLSRRAHTPDNRIFSTQERQASEHASERLKTAANDDIASLRKQVDEAIAGLATDRKKRKPSARARQVQTDIERQLKEAGRTDEQAKAEAAVHGAFAHVAETHYGADLEDLYGSLDIQKGGKQAGGLEQPGRSAFDWTPGGGSKTRVVGKTEITYGVSRDGETAEVILVKTPSNARGSGLARKAMEAFLEESDARGLTVFLTPEPMDKGISKSGLLRFYKSLGFRFNKGSKKDFRSQAAMVREPRSFEQSARDLTQNPAFKQWFGDSKVVDKDGKPLVVYHGARRGDRVDASEKFDATRATSGPMAFFTDSAELGSSYSTRKQDTSIEVEDLADFFLVDGEPLSKTKLSASVRVKIRRDGHKIRYDEDADKYSLDGAGEDVYSEDHWKWAVRDNRNDPVRALYDVWVNSGLIFGEERRFKEILELFGAEKIVYDDPHSESPTVFPVYINIKNPLVTSSIPDKLLDDLEQASFSAPKPEFSQGVDQWDKRSQDPSDWIDRLKEDRRTGNSSYAWTSIPDWVTEVLRENGYDGIFDVGGKGGGSEHRVFIPFEETQIKSVHNRGTFDPSDPRILNQESRGRITFGDRTTIQLFEGADASTVMHESAHFFFETMDNLATEGAPQRLLDDLQALKEFAGVGEKITVEGHEKVARAFEAYLREGKAPSPELEGVFARVRDWLVQLYRSIKDLDINLTDEVRATFDRMLATDDQIDLPDAVRAEIDAADIAIADAVTRGKALDRAATCLLGVF